MFACVLYEVRQQVVSEETPEPGLYLKYVIVPRRKLYNIYGGRSKDIVYGKIWKKKPGFLRLMKSIIDSMRTNASEFVQFLYKYEINRRMFNVVWFRCSRVEYKISCMFMSKARFWFWNFICLDSWQIQRVCVYVFACIIFVMAFRRSVEVEKIKNCLW